MSHRADNLNDIFEHNVTIRETCTAKTIITDNHDSDGDKPEIVNVVYGTDATPPDATSVPIGTIYIQYTA